MASSLTESSAEKVTAPAPTHIEHTVQAIVRLRAEHVGRASLLQRTIERFTGRAGSPGFAVLLTVPVATWIGLNCLLPVFGRRPLEEPPFYWMQGAVALSALYMTVFILAAPRREDELANRHEQLTLELEMLSEQKAAEIISLLEQLLDRRLSGPTDEIFARSLRFNFSRFSRIWPHTQRRRYQSP